MPSRRPLPEHKPDQSYTPSHRSFCLPASSLSPSSELTSTINLAVTAMNDLTDASIKAWELVQPAFAASRQLCESEIPFRKTIRDLAGRAIPKADAFERLQIEAEFNEQLRLREKEVFRVGRMLDGVVEAFREVDGMRQACEKQAKHLEHCFALAKTAGLSDHQDLGGYLVLRIGLGGDAPLPQPRFQYGLSEGVYGMTVANARKLKQEIERRMAIVRAHYIRSLEDVPAMRSIYTDLHDGSTQDTPLLREFIRTGDSKILDTIYDKLKEEIAKKEATGKGVKDMVKPAHEYFMERK